MKKELLEFIELTIEMKKNRRELKGKLDYFLRLLYITK